MHGGHTIRLLLLLLLICSFAHASGSSSPSSGQLVGYIVGSIAGVGIVVTVVLVVFCYCRRRHRGPDAPAEKDKPAGDIHDRTSKKLSTSIPLPEIIISKCRQLHDLVFTRRDDKVYVGRHIWQRCNCCGESYMLKDGGWRCDKCDFDVCLQCKAARANRALKYPVCSMGHVLVKSIYVGMYSHLPYYGGEYVCAACEQHKKCAEGRWFCVYCLVDVCQECQRKEDAGKESVSIRDVTAVIADNRANETEMRIDGVPGKI